MSLSRYIYAALAASIVAVAMVTFVPPSYATQSITCSAPEKLGDFFTCMLTDNTRNPGDVVSWSVRDNRYGTNLSLGETVFVRDDLSATPYAVSPGDLRADFPAFTVQATAAESGTSYYTNMVTVADASLVGPTNVTVGGTYTYVFSPDPHLYTTNISAQMVADGSAPILGTSIDGGQTVVFTWTPSTVGPVLLEARSATLSVFPSDANLAVTVNPADTMTIHGEPTVEAGSSNVFTVASDGFPEGRITVSAGALGPIASQTVNEGDEIVSFTWVPGIAGSYSLTATDSAGYTSAAFTVSVVLPTQYTVAQTLLASAKSAQLSAASVIASNLAAAQAQSASASVIKAAASKAAASMLTVKAQYSSAQALQKTISDFVKYLPASERSSALLGVNGTVAEMSTVYYQAENNIAAFDSLTGVSGNVSNDTSSNSGVTQSDALKNVTNSPVVTSQSSPDKPSLSKAVLAKTIDQRVSISFTKKGSTKLTKQAKQLITKAAEMLKATPKAVITIHGYTPEGASRPQGGHTLDDRRAQVVYKYLLAKATTGEKKISKKVFAAKVTTVGAGELSQSYAPKVAAIKNGGAELLVKQQKPIGGNS